MKKIVIFIGMIIVVSIICIVCYECSDPAIQPLDVFDLGEKASIIALHDENIVYMEINGQNVDFFLYDTVQKGSIYIGTIENVKIISNEVVLIDNCLYTNIIIDETNNPTYTYKINLQNFAIDPIREVMSYDTFAPITNLGEEIAILECKVLDNIHGESIISTLDSSGNSITHLIFSSNRDDFSGEYIWDFTTNNDSLFTITDSWSENKIFLEQYDSNFKMVKKIDLTKTIGYLENQKIHEFDVLDNFAFISNFSRSSVLFSISDDSIFHLVESSYENPFMKAKSNESQPVFFISDSPYIFYLDKENNHIIQSKLKFDTECKIKNMYIGENTTIVTLKDVKDIYIIDNKDLYSKSSKRFPLSNKTYIATVDGLKK